MRTLTVNEIGFVSGGEAPCITLGTPCVGSGPSITQMRRTLNMAQHAAAAAIMRYPGAAYPLGGAIIFMGVISELLSWAE